MAILDKFRKSNEIRSETSAETTFVSSATSFSNFFNAGKIDEDKVLGIPTAKACVDVIANTIATLPVKLYKEDADGKIETFNHDERLKFLNEEVNEFTHGSNLKRQMAKDRTLHGNTYVGVDSIPRMVDGKITYKINELQPFSAKNVDVVKYVNKQTGNLVRAEIKVFNETLGKNIIFKPVDMLIATDDIDSLTGRGAIEYGKDTFEKAIVEMKSSKNFFERGGVPLGVLSTKDKLNSDQIDKVQAEWKLKYGGINKSNETVVLHNGMTYTPLQPLTLDNEKERNAIDENICKVFGVPYSKIHSKNNSTNTNLEQDNKYFLQNSLSPIITDLEQSFNSKLLTEAEKRDGWYFRFDVSELERASQKENVDSINSLVDRSILSINEARAKLDLPPLKKDRFKSAPGTVFIDEQGNLFAQGVDASKTSPVDDTDDTGATFI